MNYFLVIDSYGITTILLVISVKVGKGVGKLFIKQQKTPHTLHMKGF